MNSPPAPDAFLPEDSFEDDASSCDAEEPDCYETIMAALHDEDAEHADESGLTPTLDGTSVLNDGFVVQTIETNDAKFDKTLQSPEQGTVKDSGKLATGAAMPDRVGKFAIKRELGRGAFGVVYLGYDEELERNVAIKVSLVSDPERQQKLKTEASKAAQIESSGIVPVYHIGTTDQGLVFIVHKFIPGCSLRDVLKQGPISPSRATALMRDLSLAMAPAHQLDILHRDLKPDNVLIDKQGNSWIADFGLAISESEQTSQRRELAGTPPYMSPEQIKGRVDFLDPRSDLWALGVMYYELLSGKLPFRGKCRASLTEQICERDPRPLQQYAPRILTDEINEVFSKACAKQPADRYSTVVEFANALDELLDSDLSEQNILGESTEDRFGDEDGDFLPVRSRPNSQASRGSFSRNSLRSKDHKFASTDSSGNRNRWILAGGLMSLVACFIGAGLFFRGTGLFYLNSLANPEPAVAAVANIGPKIPELDKVGEVLPIAEEGAGNIAKESEGPELVVKPASMPPEPKPLPEGNQDDPMIVAADGTGSHQTLVAAILDSPPGGFIQLTPGSYSETLLIEKPLTIYGPPSVPDEEMNCILRNDADTVVRIACETGQVSMRGISIKGNGTKMTNEFNAVEVLSGALIIQDMDLTTSSFNCVKVLPGGVFGARNCRFYDSRKIAVSARDHANVQLENCRFRGAGVELIGGGGKISGCEFFGARGVWCKQNNAVVRIVDCTFDNGSSNSVAALQGGRINIENSQFLQGDKAIQVTGGEVVVQPGCLINDFAVAAFISSGSLNMNATEILESGGSAIQVAGTAKVRINDCKIEGASAFGIDMVSGSLEVVGGSIVGCQLGCINLDATDANANNPDGGDDQKVPSLIASLADCTLSSPNVGVAIRQGDLTLANVDINSGGRRGAGIGVFVDGSKIDEKAPPAMVRIKDNVRFSDSLKISVFAKGNSLLDVPAKMQVSLQETARLMPPASYMDPVPNPVPNPGTESE